LDLELQMMYSLGNKKLHLLVEFRTLYSASGLEIDSDDDDGANWNPSLYWTCQTSGDYYFLIEGYSDEEVGYYSVSVSASTTLQKTPSASIEKKHRLVEKIRLSDLFFD